MKWLFIIAGAVIAWLLYRSESSDSGSTPSITIPALVAPVITGGISEFSQSCTGKTDSQGNWYGVDISGNCTVNALGGAGSEW
jgi:hypothetical protein